ncbi:MAG: hypothetical protein AB1899_18405 [Pseudomonadota bacterium]
MQYNRLTLGVALALLASQPVTASETEPLVCRPGQTHATLTGGYAITHPVNDIRQVGRICLTLSDDQGQTVFHQCGALNGQIKAVDPYTGAPSQLSHRAVFPTEELFQTAGDTVTYFYPTDPNDPAPCAFNVGEVFNHVKVGTGIFHRGQLRVEAHGLMDFCSELPTNTFDLTGEACLNLGH